MLLHVSIVCVKVLYIVCVLVFLAYELRCNYNNLEHLIKIMYSGFRIFCILVVTRQLHEFVHKTSVDSRRYCLVVIIGTILLVLVVSVFKFTALDFNLLDVYLFCQLICPLIFVVYFCLFYQFVCLCKFSFSLV